MPAAALSRFINRIRRSSKVAFLCAIVAGFVTHLFIMTNKVMNHNELSNLFLDTHEMTMGRMAEGRWFVGWIGQLIGDNYSMQMVVGVLGILLIACAAGMVVSLLDISKPLYAGLLGASMTVFPALFFPTRIKAFSISRISKSRIDLKFCMRSFCKCINTPPSLISGLHKTALISNTFYLENCVVTNTL